MNIFQNAYRPKKIGIPTYAVKKLVMTSESHVLFVNTLKPLKRMILSGASAKERATGKYTYRPKYTNAQYARYGWNGDLKTSVLRSTPCAIRAL